VIIMVAQSSPELGKQYTLSFQNDLISLCVLPMQRNY